jgi:hypothetical protein
MCSKNETDIFPQVTLVFLFVTDCFVYVTSLLRVLCNNLNINEECFNVKYDSC